MGSQATLLGAPAFTKRCTLSSAPLYAIEKAAKRANCGAAEILRLILDKRLRWVGKIDGVHGIAAILVRLDEIKASIRGSLARDLMRSDEIALLLQIDRGTASLLITHGILPHKIVRNPTNRCPMCVVPRAEVERFDEQYISLTRLACVARMNGKTLATALGRAGIQPALDEKAFRAKIYDRAIVLEAIPKK